METKVKSICTQNSKLKKTSKEMGVRLFNFGIPALETPDGKRTCPFAGSCAKFCYAQKGAYSWGNVKPAFKARYMLTKDENFVEIMVEEIKKKKMEYLRVHDSGDYYSRGYIAKWLEVMKRLPEVRFYSYTKSHSLFEGLDLPENFDMIKSVGGKHDDRINPETDRHAFIFDSKEELEDAGYVDASKNDLMATKWFNENNKVGLILH